MSTLIAYDYSSSTAGNKNYHNISKQIANKYPDATIIAWNNSYKKISHTDLERINKNLDGDNGTDVTCVAKAIINMQFSGKLVLITDGEVDKRNINECEYLFNNYKNITDAEIHIVGVNANMSVSCPFTRYCPHIVHKYTFDNIPTIVNITSEDFNTLEMIDNISTLAEFETKYDAINRAITARLMGKSEIDQNMHDQIVRLKKRIDQDVSNMATLGSKDNIKNLSDLCRSDFDSAIDIYKSIAHTYYNGNNKPYEQQLADLLNITKDGLKNVFSHRMRRADTIEEKYVCNIELSEDQQTNTFLCPITYDDETEIALLIKENSLGLLNSLDPNQIENIINCPLNALNYTSFIEAFKESLDVGVSIGALKVADALNKPLEISPITRAQLSGAIYLGSNKTQVDASNWTLGKLLCGTTSKKIGNMNLWYAVFYFVIKQIERFKDILPFAESHMKYRLVHGTTWASMSGQTKYVNIKVPLGVSCWMVAVSPLLKLLPTNDMIRGHVWHMDAIFELNDLYGGILGPDKERLKNHVKRLKTLYKFLENCKSDNDFHTKSMIYYQKCLKLVDGTVIPIDGVADNPNYESAFISQMVHRNLNADDIQLYYDWLPQIILPNISWPDYGLDTKTTHVITPVCLATVRPHYFKNYTWRESFLKTYKFNSEKCISLHAWYISYVSKYKSYPVCIDDFIKYVYKRCKNRNIKTLPAPIVQFAEEILNSYESVASTITPDEFIKRANKSLCIKDRILIEQSC